MQGLGGAGPCCLDHGNQTLLSLGSSCPLPEATSHWISDSLPPPTCPSPRRRKAGCEPSGGGGRKDGSLQGESSVVHGPWGREGFEKPRLLLAGLWSCSGTFFLSRPQLPERLVFPACKGLRSPQPFFSRELLDRRRRPTHCRSSGSQALPRSCNGGSMELPAQPGIEPTAWLCAPTGNQTHNLFGLWGEAPTH